MTRCGECGQSVDQAAHRDTHDPKQCLDCKRNLPIAQFALHPSAGDGRRRSCDRCVQNDREKQAVGRAELRESERKSRNARFRDRGYRWVPCQTPELHTRHRLDLLDPGGQIVDPQTAEDRINQLEHDENPEQWDNYDYPF